MLGVPPGWVVVEQGDSSGSAEFDDPARLRRYHCDRCP